MPAPPAILFDLGGTILEERSYDLGAGVRELLADDTLPTHRGPDEADAATDELQAEIDRVHRTNTGEFTLLDWLARELAAPTPDTRARAERLLWHRIAHLEPLPGAREGIAELARDGVRLGVVSNAVFTSATLASELARHDLGRPFALILSSAELGVRKPDPGIFRQALARLGSAAEETWFVGDCFANDVAGAHAAGLQALWLAPAGEPRADVPHRRARDWDELIALYRGGCFR